MCVAGRDVDCRHQIVVLRLELGSPRGSSLGHRPDEVGRHVRPRAAAQLLREGDRPPPVAVDVFVPVQ